MITILVILNSFTNQQSIQTQIEDEDNDVVDDFFSDELVNIDVEEQAKLLLEAEFKCNHNKTKKKNGNILVFWEIIS